MGKREQEPRSPFDVTGPSILGASLEKYQSTRRKVSGNLTQKRALIGWGIDKKDENEQFLAQNAANFGTRQRRNK